MANNYADIGLEYLNSLALDQAKYVFKLDQDGNTIPPTIVLSRRNGDKINAINNVSNIRQVFDLQSVFELSFNVFKTLDGKDCEVWDDINDFMLIYLPDYNLWFEIYVESHEDNQIYKAVSCIHLPEAELSQVLLHNIEINTEDDLMLHTDLNTGDYRKTVLYTQEKVLIDNGDGTSSYVSLSLLDRILEKAPHYSVYHVDESIAGLYREFSFDQTSIADALDEIAEQFECVVVYGEGENYEGLPQRTISIYDMLDYCEDCGERGLFYDGYCSECGSTNIVNGYGQDTNIFINNENLANEIISTNDTDSMKNCFKLQGGDDVMTAAIAACNPGGGEYIWYMSEDSISQMSNELKTKLQVYEADYEKYAKEYVTDFTSETTSIYNGLVYKYKQYNDSLNTIPSEVVGYDPLVLAEYEAMDLYNYLNTSLMPTSSLDDTSAFKQISNLTPENISVVGVSNVETCSLATADLAVKNYLKVYIDTAKYSIEISNSSLNDHVWKGSVKVSSYSTLDRDVKDRDEATVSLTITLNDDIETTTRQKMEKILADSDNDYGIVALLKKDLEDFEVEIQRHSLDNLRLFINCVDDAFNILIQQGSAEDSNSEIYKKLVVPLLDKRTALNTEAKVRESELKSIQEMQVLISSAMYYIASHVDLQNYLGEELWLEYVSFRREETYSNENFISDGLSNVEIIDNAKLFHKTALRDIKKSATLQHTITSSLKNLMLIPEFKPILHYFKLGNWLRIKVDGVVYKLRLSSYAIDYSNPQNLEVTFSDVHRQSSLVASVKRTFAQLKSKSTSYNYSSGAAIPNNIYLGRTGIIVRRFDDETDDFDESQVRILPNGMYYTDDGWRTVKNAKKMVEEAIENFDGIVNAANGTFTTIVLDQNGAEITYLHNRENLKQSTMVWKISAQAIAAWSGTAGSFDPDDPDLHWNGGVTVSGDVIAQILYSHGINADWINAGAIVVKDENDDVIFSVDVDRKEVIINAENVYINGQKTVSVAIGELQQSIDDVVDTAKEEAKKTAEELVEDITDDIQAAVEASINAEASAELAKQYAEQSVTTANGLQEKINQAIDDVAEVKDRTQAVEGQVEAINTTIKDVQDEAVQIRTDMASQIEVAKTEMTASYKEVVDAARPEIDANYQSAISQSALEIKQEVSQTYATKTEVTDAIGKNAQDLSNAIESFNTDIQSLQGQLDGSINTWFYDGEPKNDNQPAVDWTDDAQKNTHLGDLYYDLVTGYCYRYLVANDIYGWQKITDTDVTKALADAAKAQDTADNKRRVFTTISAPNPPYDVGDLWVQGSGGDIKVCNVSKTAQQTFAESDWILASKYTDDSSVVELKQQTESSIKQLSDQITATVTKVENIETDISDFAQTAVDAAQAAVEEANQASEAANAQALEALEQAIVAQNYLTSAKQDLSNAENELKEAQERLEILNNKPDATPEELLVAQQLVAIAQNTLESAQGQYNSAVKRVEEAVAEATRLSEAAGAAMQAAVEAQLKAKEAENELNSLKNRVITNETKIDQTSEQITISATETREYAEGLADEAKEAAIGVAADAIKSFVSSIGGETSYTQTDNTFTWTVSTPPNAVDSTARDAASTAQTTADSKVDADAALQIAKNAITSTVWDAQLGTSTNITQTANGFQIVINKDDIRGTDGASSYTHIRYSANSDGEGFTSKPSSETRYIGIYTGASRTAPTNKEDYSPWSEYVGSDGESALTVLIESTNGNVFKDANIQTTLKCRVYYGTTEITDSDLITRFVWQKRDQYGNLVEDEKWSQITYTNSINITNEDVLNKATITCFVEADLPTVSKVDKNASIATAGEALSYIGIRV